MVLRTIILCAVSAAYAATTDEVAQLSTQDTLVLLDDWNLREEFGSEFAERNYDGYTLTQVTKSDIDAEFPDSTPFQRRALWGRIQDLFRAERLSRRLQKGSKPADLSGYNGLNVRIDKALLTLGAKDDIVMFRGKDGGLRFRAPKGVDFVTPKLTQNGKQLSSGSPLGNLVIGCADEKFVEFNPKANINDKKQCKTPRVKGCMQMKSPEYNPQANINDGSCDTTAGLPNYGFEYYPYDFCNLLQNVNLDNGWAKGYNKDIKWNDGPPPPSVKDKGAKVVSFRDANADGDGFWYSYGDQAPMQPGETYTVSIWVKTNKVNGGAVKIRMYTANNEEKGRITGAYLTVKASEGWKRLAWNFVDPPESFSDSMSFRFADFKAPTKLWLCCPQLEHAQNKKTPAPRPFSSVSCLNKAGGEKNGGYIIDTNSKFLVGWKVNQQVTRVRRKAAGYGGIDAAEGKFYVALNAGCNLLRNVNLNEGWSQDYNKNIKWNDGTAPVKHPEAVVVSFQDKDTNGDGYWYSYGDYAPMRPGTWYTASIYVKTDKASGSVNVNAYTADNNEKGRKNLNALPVTKKDGWKRLAWTFQDPSNSKSDSLSFHWTGLKQPTKLWLCCPQLEYALAPNVKTVQPKPFCGAYDGGSITTTVRNMIVGQTYILRWFERNRPGRMRERLMMKMNGNYLSYNLVHATNDWDQRSFTFPAQAPTSTFTLSGLGPGGDGEVLLDEFDLQASALANGGFDHSKNCNLLKNENLNTGWSKGYNKNIKWNDGAQPKQLNEKAAVVSFQDADKNGDGYWYSYGDYAVMVPGNYYIASVWAKTDAKGTVNINAYTADNNEAGRHWLKHLPLKKSDGWKRLVWKFLDPIGSGSDSLSFHWTGLTNPAKLWLSAPQLEHGGKYNLREATPYTSRDCPMKGNVDMTQSGYELSTNSNYLPGWKIEAPVTLVKSESPAWGNVWAPSGDQFLELNTNCNLLKNYNLNTGWSKGYNKNIKWDDGPKPDQVTDKGARVVSFEDSNTDGAGYWYSYGDYAPMQPGKWYTASIWVKTNKPSGTVNINAYTADNNEKGRNFLKHQPLTKADGWKRLSFTFMDPKDSKSDSLSFNWSGMSKGVRLWLCCPQLENSASGNKVAKPFTSRTCNNNKGGRISTTSTVTPGKPYVLEWKERHRPGHPIRKIKVTVNNKVASQHPVNSDWSHRGVSFRAPTSGKVPIKFDGIDASLASSGQGSVFLDDVHVLQVSEQVFKDLNKGCNLLKYPGLNSGWSQGYNKDIKWHDGELPTGVTDVGARVVSFVDLNTDGGGYWYSYGDYAPMQPGKWYTASIYVKTNKPSGKVEMNAYTADNNEKGRHWLKHLPVTKNDGWKRLSWTFMDPLNSKSDSLSFNWKGLTSGARMWLCCPQLERTIKDVNNPKVFTTKKC